MNKFPVIDQIGIIMHKENNRLDHPFVHHCIKPDVVKMIRNSVGVKNLTCHTQLSSNVKPVPIPVNITNKHIKSVA